MGAIPRLIVTLVCTVAVGLALSLIVPATHAQSEQPVVVVAKMDGPITPVMAGASCTMIGRPTRAAMVV